MMYPGNPELSAQAQERVMSAFRQVVAKIQDGLSNEALIGLEFVLRLDPTFAPGVTLQRQLISGQSDIDLSSIIAQLESPDTDAINLLLIEAVEDFNQHNYLEAKEKVEKVLIDLPGHREARSLAAQIDDALKVETQVGQFLTQAKEALADNRPQDAVNFVLMAQALDPHHSGIEATLAEIHQADPAPQTVPGADAGPFNQMPQTPADPATTMAVDSSEAFGAEAESDSWDVAGAFEDPAFELVQGAGPHPKPAGLELGGDVADLFEASSGAAETPLWDKPASSAQPPVEDTDQVGNLITRGTAALEAGDPQEALHYLSRILLIDPENSQAEALINRARSAIDALETQLQTSLSEAEMAWDSGDMTRARAVIEEILIAAPDNEDALALKARFDSEGSDEPSPPVDPVIPPASESASSLEESPPDAFGAFEDFDSAFDSLASIPQLTTGDQPIGRGAERRVPWRWVILGVGGVAVVLVGMWLGSSFLPQGEEDVDIARAVTELIDNAQVLFDQGKGEEALDLLRTFEAEGIDKQRIDKHIARYEAAMIPPTPTPIPESVGRGQDLMDQGRWFDAYQTVDAGLSQHPGDSMLLGLKEQITVIEPRITALFGAMAKRDYQTAAHLAGELADRHPDQEGFGLVMDRCLFNAALAHLRTYNLTAARGYLRRLHARHPDDKDVTRILEFISSYTNRPVDMQLEIFVGSLGFR